MSTLPLLVSEPGAHTGSNARPATEFEPEPNTGDGSCPAGCTPLFGGFHVVVSRKHMLFKVFLSRGVVVSGVEEKTSENLVWPLRRCVVCEKDGEDVEAVGRCTSAACHDMLLCEGHAIVHRTQPSTMSHVVVIEDPVVTMKAKLLPHQIISEACILDRSRIGAGGYGVVYAADLTTAAAESGGLHVGHEKVCLKVGKAVITDTVAINKIIRLSLSSQVLQGLSDGTTLPGSREELQILEDFAKEVIMLAGLHHTNLLSFRGVVMSKDGKSPKSIVTELADCNLKQWLLNLKSPLALVKVVGLWLQLARGLHFLHSQTSQIVHRDIKPNNILVFNEADGEVFKLADVGLSRFLNDSLVYRTAKSKGNFDYAAPEVIDSDGNIYEPASDIYALALLVAEIVVSCVVGQSLEETEKRRKIAGWKPILDELSLFLRREKQSELGNLFERCLLPPPRLKARPSSGDVVKYLATLKSKLMEGTLALDHFDPVLDITLALGDSDEPEPKLNSKHSEATANVGGSVDRVDTSASVRQRTEGESAPCYALYDQVTEALQAHKSILSSLTPMTVDVRFRDATGRGATTTVLADPCQAVYSQAASPNCSAVISSLLQQLKDDAPVESLVQSCRTVLKLAVFSHFRAEVESNNFVSRFLLWSRNQSDQITKKLQVDCPGRVSEVTDLTFAPTSVAPVDGEHEVICVICDVLTSVSRTHQGRHRFVVDHGLDFVQSVQCILVGLRNRSLRASARAVGIHMSHLLVGICIDQYLRGVYLGPPYNGLFTLFLLAQDAGVGATCSFGSLAALLLADSRINTEKYRQKTVVDSIIGLAKAQLHNQAIQLGCCVGLRLLAVTDEMEVHVAEVGLQLIRDVMARFHDSAPIQEACILAISNVSANLTNKVTIVKKGGLGSIFAAMKNLSQEPAVQEAACRALWNLSENDDNKQAIVESDGLVLVLAAMRTHSTTAGLQEAACWTLRNLSFRVNWSSYNASIHRMHCIVKASLAAQASESTSALPGNEGLCQDSLVSLPLAVSSFPAEDVDVAAVFSVLDSETLRDESHAQEAACCALWNLSQQPKYKGVLMKKGRLDRVLAVMSRFSQVARIQTACCGVLWNLAVDPANADEIFREGGLTAVLSAMRIHRLNVEVQISCCNVLANLARTGASATTKAIASASKHEDALVDVLAAMSNHAKEAGAQIAACQVLVNLAVDHVISARIVQLGGVSHIVNAMMIHAGAAGVQVSCCAAIRNLAANSENQPIMANAGFLGVLRSVFQGLSNRQDDANVLEAGYGALRNLIENSDIAARIIQEGWLTDIVATLSLHSESKAVQAACWGALWNLSDRSEDAFSEAVSLVVGGASIPEFGIGSVTEFVAKSLINAGFLAEALDALKPATTSCHRDLTTEESVAEVKELRANAFECLSNLATCNVGNKAICDSGGVATLLSFIESHFTELQGDSGFCASCETIWGLALRAETVPELLRCGALDLIVALMRAHPSDEEMVKYGCLAIGLIAVSSESALQAVVSHTGVLDCLSGARSGHSECEDVVRLCSAIEAKRTKPADSASMHEPPLKSGRQE